MEYSLCYYLFELILRGKYMNFLAQHYPHPIPEQRSCRRPCGHPGGNDFRNANQPCPPAGHVPKTWDLLVWVPALFSCSFLLG